MTASTQDAASIPAQHLPTVAGMPVVMPSARPRVARADWKNRYARRLLLGDVVSVSAATATALGLSFNGADERLRGLPYVAVAVLLCVGWLLALASGRAYELRFLGTGSDEYKRVCNSSLHLLAAIGLVTLALRLSLARSFIALALVLGTGLLLLHRFLARRVLYRARAAGEATHRVLVVGDNDAVSRLMSTFQRDKRAGYDVVGAYAPTDGVSPLAVAQEVGADTIAVTASAGVSPEVLRAIAWQIEGHGIDLIVAPALTDVAGPRVSIRPVAGLPLLHVEQPDITGTRYLVKEIVERSLAALILLAAAPLVLAVALAIKLTSPGPVFFSQTRLARHGREFTIYKFRSMRVDAESLLETLREQNEVVDGPLFKMRRDPRVTKVGAWLRRYSLDELPQLLNVVRGDMALIGPRPLLPTEAAGCGGGESRRLLVKPGMTGLWQVSGRSDLSWDESVRLDLYYVENWSLALDAQILVRTARAVVQGSGAY